MKNSIKKADKKAKAAKVNTENTQVISSTSEKKNKAAKVAEEVTKVSKKDLKKAKKAKKTPDLKEEVVSHREVKWIYPADKVTPMDRKSWRQKARHEINKLKSELFDILDKGSAEYKEKEKELKAKEKEYLKSAVA